MLIFMTFASCKWQVGTDKLKTSKYPTEVSMKIKMIPMLASAIALSVVVAPFAVKAHTLSSGQPLIAQAQTGYQKHQKQWKNINLTDAQKQQLRQIHEDTRSQIEGVLTPEQKAKLAEFKKQKPSGQNRENRQDIMSSLNLTDAQKAQIKQIRQQQKEKMDAVFTPEQKQQIQKMRQEGQQNRQQRQQQGN